jgi:hypothetical protein
MARRFEDLEAKRREVLDDIAYVMQVGWLVDSRIVRRIAVHGMSEHDPIRRMGIYRNAGILLEQPRNSVHVIEMSMREKDGSQTEVVPRKEREQEISVLSGIKDKRIFTAPEDYAVRLVYAYRDYLV